jgi:hypothetical protein
MSRSVPDENDSRDAALDQAALQLSDGLKNCRKVVEDYRAMLSERAEPETEAIRIAEPSSLEEKPGAVPESGAATPKS